MKKVWKNICALNDVESFHMDKEDNTVTLLGEQMDAIEAKLKEDAEAIAAHDEKKGKWKKKEEALNADLAAAQKEAADFKTKYEAMQKDLATANEAKTAIEKENGELKAKVALLPPDGGGAPAGAGGGGNGGATEFTKVADKLYHNKKADEALASAGVTGEGKYVRRSKRVPAEA